MASDRPEHELLDDGEGIRVAGWTVRRTSGPIAKAAEISELEAAFENVKLPGMVFPSASLTLAHKSADLRLSFTPRGALSLVGSDPPDKNLRVAAASVWEKRVQGRSASLPTVGGDWTFTSDYSGNLSLSEAGHANNGSELPPAGRVAIDYDLCRRQDIPILYFSETLLYEDELDDNGAVSMSVRVRVMPSFFLVLSRYWLRVDGVTARSLETRWFHVFGEPVLVCERQRKSCAAGTLNKIHFAVQRDLDRMQEHMTLESTDTSCVYVDGLKEKTYGQPKPCRDIAP